MSVTFSLRSPKMNWAGQFSKGFKLHDCAYKQEWKTKIRQVHQELSLERHVCETSQWIMIPLYQNQFLCSWCELKITINEEDEFLRLWQKSIDEHCIVIDKTLRLIDTPPAPFTDVNETVLKRDWTFVHNFA